MEDENAAESSNYGYVYILGSALYMTRNVDRKRVGWQIRSAI